MILADEHSANLISNSVIDNPDTLDGIPRKSIVHEELRLFAFFDRRITPVAGMYSSPINKRLYLVQVGSKTATYRVCPSVSIRVSPLLYVCYFDSRF